MIAMTIRTVGHVFTIPSIKGSSMGLILIRGIFVTGSATLAAHKKIRVLLMRKRVFIDVTIQTLHSLMYRVRQVFRNDRLMFPGFMALHTGAAVDLFILLLLFLRSTERDQKYTKEKNNDTHKNIFLHDSAYQNISF
jgi:hypothetical protein